jgi:secondary thiamine-phosphate synthase enzyme
VLAEAEVEISIPNSKEVIDWCWDQRVPIVSAEARRNWVYNDVPLRLTRSVGKGRRVDRRIASVVVTERRHIATRGQGDAHDITELASEAVAHSGISSGIVTVFVVGSTAAVTTIEFEPGAVADLNGLFEKLAPRDDEYRHHLRWGDDNGSSHVRAALLGPSLTIPFADGRLTLGTWQQVMLLEFDTRARRRELVFQILGE